MSFSAQISHFGEATQLKIQNVRRGVTLKLFNAVIRDTPVDTGLLRGNWRFSTKEPIKTATANTSAQAVTQAVQAGIEATTGDETVYLVNNLPYAYRIEYEGWSKVKAPQGMVRRNVARFGRLITIEVSKEKKK